MRHRRIALLGLAAALVVCDSGCFFRRWRDPYYQNQRFPLLNRRDDPPPPSAFPPGPFANPTPYPPGAIPPGAYPAPVPPNGISGPIGPGVAPGTAPGGPEVLTPQNPPPGGLGPNQSGYINPPRGGLRPAEHLAVPGPRSAPQRSTTEPPLARATPFTPPRVEYLPPDLLRPSVTESSTTLPPTNTDASPSLPVDIVGFGEPKEKLATGRRPSTEGLDWLQRNRYQAVLYLRRPGTDDSADREQVEKRGMKYLAIEIAPESLNREVLDQFNRTVADAANLPLFVYDRDGLLTGAMWYLHFRTIDQMPDDLARTKAESYGLRMDGDDEVKKLWSAIQLLMGSKLD